MFTRKLSWSSLLLAVLLLGVTTVATLPLAAQDRDDGRDHQRGWERECSLRTLHGRFGWFGQGTVLAVPNVHPSLPLVVSGVITYDGEGNVSGTYNQSVAGAIATGLKLEGSYQVNPDCTYSSQITLLATGSIVNRVGTITGEGINQEIHILYTDPSPVAFGTLKKTPERCSLETLKGDYALFGNGLIFVSPTASIPRATAGLLTFDGKGNFEGAATGNTNGGITQGNFTGKYTVSAECEVTAGIDITSGPNQGLHFDEMGSVTGEGESKEIHDIFTTAHWVFTDTLKKQ